MSVLAADRGAAADGAAGVLGPPVPGGATMRDPLLARLSRDPGALVAPQPSAPRLDDAAADLRAVAAAVRYLAEAVAASEAATVGCRQWEGRAAEAQQTWSGRVVEGCRRVADVATRAASAVGDLAATVAGLTADVDRMRAEATVAAAVHDTATVDDVWSRYEAATARALAAEADCAAALADATADLPTGASWTGVVLGLTGQQWRDAGRAAGTVAWEAGPETAAATLRYLTLLGWLGLADGVLDAEDAAFDRLVAWGGGHAGTATHDGVYWVGTGMLAATPTPVGKPSVVGRAAGELPTAVRGAAVVDGPVRSGRAAGPWAGPAGLGLSAADHAAVLAHLDRVAAVEPGITARLGDVADRLDVDLAGLDRRLKEPESTLRKVASDLADGAVDTSVATVLDGVHDAVRYTMVADPVTYADDVAAATSALRSSGFRPVDWDVRWGGPGYQGVNSTWQDVGTGLLVEVQFHTPASHWARHVTHPLYEERRLPGLSAERSATVQRLEDEVFAQVERPSGLDRLPDPVTAGP